MPGSPRTSSISASEMEAWERPGTTRRNKLRLPLPRSSGSVDLPRAIVRVQVQPIDAFDLERHMTLEHVVDVRHARTPPRMVNAKGGLCPADHSALKGGPGGGLTPAR